MSSESTVSLVKNYCFELNSVPSQGWQSKKFKAKEATLTRSSMLAGWSSYVKDLSEYIKARGPEYALLTFSAKIRYGQTDFDVVFTDNFMKRLCGIFPNDRFIEINGKIVSSGNGGTVPFNKRFDLTVEGFALEQTLVHGTDCKNGNFTCDIIVGWSDTSSRRSFGANFSTNSNADVWKIVTGDGAEIKCQRSVVDALFGGRIEMKENSEEGIHYLTQYLSKSGLKINELTCEVAVELFKTAGKYQLRELEDNLAQLFLRKGRHWFTPDDLVELYLQAKNDNWTGLPDHLLTIMLSSSQEIRKCKRFEELSSIDALDLTWSLCDIKIKQK